VELVWDRMHRIVAPAGPASDQFSQIQVRPNFQPEFRIQLSPKRLSCRDADILKIQQLSLELGLKAEELNDDCDVNYSTFSTLSLLVCFCCWQIGKCRCSQLSTLRFYATTLHLQSTVPKSGLGSGRIWVDESGQVRLRPDVEN